MNGNETGGPSLLLKTKSGFKETKVPRPKAQENEETNYPPILHKPQFKRPAAVTADRQLTKVSQSTIMGGSEMPHIGIKLNTLKSRKPFLSVQIPNPAPQSSPVLRDIPMFDRNASTLDYPISALRSREASTAWGMTPLGNVMELTLDRDNSGFTFYSNKPAGDMKPSGFPRSCFESNTPTFQCYKHTAIQSRARIPHLCTLCYIEL
jgi:hypothetical protein